MSSDAQPPFIPGLALSRIKRLPPRLGNATQWTDATDVLGYPDR